MARLLLTFFGLLLLGVGVWLAMRWWPALLLFLQSAFILLLLLAGLLLLIFGISEMVGARKGTAE